MTLGIVNMHILMKAICQSVTLPVTLLIAGKSRVVSRDFLSTPTIQPLPSALSVCISLLSLSGTHEILLPKPEPQQQRHRPPSLHAHTHNMAAIVTSTRFTDEYQLYEELGK